MRLFCITHAHKAVIEVIAFGTFEHRFVGILSSLDRQREMSMYLENLTSPSWHPSQLT